MTRWGIVATGSIAQQFARGIEVLPDAEVIAVSSRTQASADAFATSFSIPHRYVGIEPLVANPEVDAVYVATPHPMHRSNTIACLEGGKAVLCEKPFAMNVAEATEMIGTARSKNLFLMEAMWTHFFPAMYRIREIISSGAIGNVRQVHASFCFRSGFDPESRLFNPNLGGGALLDVGIYCVSLARMVFQKEPVNIKSSACIGETGVDEQNAALLTYDDGAVAVLTSAVRTQTVLEAAIYGTDGYIRIPPVFWKPGSLIVKIGDGDEELMEFESVGNGYNYEAREVGDCLAAGKTESEVMPWSTTLANMKTLDTIRAQWGLTYPME